MAVPSLQYGFSSAKRILPLGLALGVLLLSPLVWYLLNRDGVSRGDLIVYVFATLSVIAAYLLVVLLFLWGAECADEAEADGERSAGEEFEEIRGS